MTKKDELAEWKQAAGVEAGLRREFLARAERAEAKLDADTRLIGELLTTLMVLVNETMFRDHPVASQMAIDVIAKAEKRLR